MYDYNFCFCGLEKYYNQDFKKGSVKDELDSIISFKVTYCGGNE